MATGEIGDEKEVAPGCTVHCGWGRMIFAHTFPDPESVANCVLEEEPGRRDIAFYVVDPHIVINYAPQQLFLDPSNTYRLNFANYQAFEGADPLFQIGPIAHKEDIDEINRIYSANGMVQVDAEHVWKHRQSPCFTYFLARHQETNEVLGITLGLDHAACFDDVRNGCSLWALAVDPQADLPGVGQMLVRHLIEHYRAAGRQEMDISVLHDNENATRLYQKLGYERIAVFAVKKRNSINEKLFVGTSMPEGYNIYATIIMKEALRRGIAVEPIDASRGFFRLSLGGRVITCQESLTELTSAIALVRTDDKQLTREILNEAGLRTPAQITAEDPDEVEAFLDRHKSVVVKPLQGEQGKGVVVDVRTKETLFEAIQQARQFSDVVLIEEYVEGEDLRIIVINQEVVAAAVRQPASITGTGEHSVRELIERQSRRRSAATDGESTIPLDAETERCVKHAGFTMEDTLPAGKIIQVRKTANLHTGGTIHDVTTNLHPTLARAAVAAAHSLEIPVVGLDLMVKAVDEPEYAFIEANERPGLANHEPQPTAQKFVDFLFPQTIAAPNRNGDSA